MGKDGANAQQCNACFMCLKQEQQDALRAVVTNEKNHDADGSQIGVTASGPQS